MTDTLNLMNTMNLVAMKDKPNGVTSLVSSPSMQGYYYQPETTTLVQVLQAATSKKGIHCYGAGQNVGHVSLKELLSQSNSTTNHQYQEQEQEQEQDTHTQRIIPTKYQLPSLKQGYDWTETKWQTLLMDAATSKSVHSLGQLTYCTQCNNNSTQSPNIEKEEEKVASDDFIIDDTNHRYHHYRSIILDGQQRFTTVTLLLAAIRDTLYKRQQRKVMDDERTTNRIIQEINQILFPDQDDYQTWLASGSPSLQEGMALSFAKLTPTDCDRWSYYSAILPLNVTVANRWTYDDASSSDTASSSNQPAAAKRYFDGMLSTFSNGEVINLLHGVYTKLSMLLVPIEFAPAGRAGGLTDGDSVKDLMMMALE